MINIKASNLYDKLLNIYKTQYNELTEDSKKMITVLNKPEMLSLDFIEDDLPSLEGDEEPEETIADRVKLNPRKRKNKGTGLKIFIPNKLLHRLPILLVQIKAGNNSCKLKNEIIKILYLLYQHNKITKKVYNNFIKSL